MRIVWAEIKKEFTLLLRDKAGLALLFLMPALLVVVMTYIQDAAFRVLSNEKVELVWIDLDQSSVSKHVGERLKESGYFLLVDSISNKPVLQKDGEGLISDGKYQVGIVIPEGFQNFFKQRVKARVDSLLQGFGLGDSAKEKQPILSQKEITLLFDPLTKATYKTSVSNGVQGLVNELETQYSFKAFQSRLAAHFPYNPNSNQSLKLDPIIQFNDQYVFKGGEGSIPSSVQHNIPAWSVFAIFFIIVSFSQRIVEQRLSGVNKRIETIGVNPIPLLFGKALTYLMISELQLLFILGLGFWVIPILGLPNLVINGSLLTLILFTVPISLSSGGLALAIGTWSKTRDQAASFGSVVVIILAALGGVWVPVFAMPSLLQSAAKASPLNWALQGYYDVILRGATLSELLLPALFLFALFAITFGLSTLKRK